MINRYTRQLNNGFSRTIGICRVVFSLACAAIAVGSQALQSGEAKDELVQSPLGRIVSPTYIEKTSTPDPLKQEAAQGWQVGGLITQYRSAIGEGTLNLSGGLYFSREFSRPKDAAGGLNFTDAGSGSGNGSASGLVGNLFSNDPMMVGKSDQVILQRIEYKGANGLSLSGSYANVGKNFQGIADLTKQMAPSDARMLGLGMSQTNYTLDYTGIRGMQFSSGRSVVENAQSGHKENGLTRTTTNNGVVMQLGQRHNIEYSINNSVEEWNPAVVTRATKESTKETLKLSGELGKKSQFTLGQTLANTHTGETQTEETQQRDLSMKWNEWENFSLDGNYLSKLNGLNKEENDVLSLNAKALLSPRFQLTGKYVDNNTVRPDAEQAIENDLLDLRLTADLAKNLQFTSGYKDTVVTGKDAVLTRDQQLTWTPASNWKVVSRFVETESEKSGYTNMREHQITSQFGAANRPEQVTMLVNDASLPNDVSQNRYELSYTRALETGKSPAKLLVHAGAYQQETGEDTRADDLFAMQLLNVHAGERTTVTAGYYDGPKLGAGYLAYRTWGEKNSNNLGLWNERDFTDYQEMGGEIAHQLNKRAKLTLKQMHGELENTGVLETVEYGAEYTIGTAKLEGSKLNASSPAKDGGRITRDFIAWRVTLPGAQPLPAWAATSARAMAFKDGASWGLGVLPAWLTTKPTNGLFAEKRQSGDAKPVDQYKVQGAGMLTEKLFLQASYEQNPLKDDSTTQTEAVSRGMLHLAYAARPNIQFYSRYCEEEYQDKAEERNTYSYGIIGQLSKTERLQFQYNTDTRTVKGETLDGNGYSLQYERNVSDADMLMLKLQINPREFSSEKDRAKVELRYNRTF